MLTALTITLKGDYVVFSEFSATGPKRRLTVTVNIGVLIG